MIIPLPCVCVNIDEYARELQKIRNLPDWFHNLITATMIGSTLIVVLDGWVFNLPTVGWIILSAVVLSVLPPGVWVLIRNVLKIRKATRQMERTAVEYAQRRSADATFSQRLDELTACLTKSQELIQDLSAEVRIRKKTLEQLTTDAEEKERKASLNAEQAAMVDRLVAERVEAQTQAYIEFTKREGRKSFLYSAVFTAFIIGLFVNWIYTGLTTGDWPFIS